ncbi:vesicle-trafficking protein SEC22c isoform X1 [Heterodontus francisci]|uniref:vesicle-trafficking protein SEC22c isoform X1 n=1 Tax=Heterodontus francisci TaxID=7792 RepID=UPI00355C21D1
MHNLTERVASLDQSIREWNLMRRRQFEAAHPSEVSTEDQSSLRRALGQQQISDGRSSPGTPDASCSSLSPLPVTSVPHTPRVSEGVPETSHGHLEMMKPTWPRAGRGRLTKSSGAKRQPDQPLPLVWLAERDRPHVFTSSQGVAYMTICCSYYPTTMAFCFLEELGMEFVSSFEIAKIHMVSRPYAFLEFDSIIQKIKWHYNYSNRPSLKISVTNIQRELKVTPPRQVKVDDIVVTNGTLNGHLYLQSGSAPSYRLEPVSAVGILSVILNIMCGALNLIRGVHLIEHNFQDGDEEKWTVVAFLVAFITCVFQCYLYLFYASARMIKAPGALILICICNSYLFGLRNVWQILFHLGVASLSTHQILTRKLTERPPDCGV